MRRMIFGLTLAEECICRQNELNNSKHLIFGTLFSIGKPEQQKEKKFPKSGVA